MVYCVSLCVCFNVGLLCFRIVGLFNSVAGVIFYYVCFFCILKFVCFRVFF